MNTPKRKYSGKDVDMLMASLTLIENAMANKTFLQTKRINWTDEFFADLQTQIHTGLEEYLGIDSAKDLRQSTQIVQAVHKQALKDLAELKVQIIEDFKSDPAKQTQMLIQLGFSAYHKEAQNGDQQALVQLLYSFKINLTETLKDEIVGKGTAPMVLDQIISFADILKSANITQETFKGTRKEITTAGITFLNEIYDQVISIGKISSKFYKDEPVKKALFSFSKIQKTLSVQKKAAAPKPTPQ